MAKLVPKLIETFISHLLLFSKQRLDNDAFLNLRRLGLNENYGIMPPWPWNPGKLPDLTMELSEEMWSQVLDELRLCSLKNIEI